MSRYYSHLNTAVSIIKEYDGSEPLANYLKKFFSSNRKYGSKDRKNISHLCYCYFRSGKATPSQPSPKGKEIEEKINSGLFLCSNQSNELLQNLRPELDEKVLMSFEEKCSALDDQFSIANIFPWKDELSDGIDYDSFCKSFLIQPDLFLRVRPGYKDDVFSKFKASGLRFEVIGEDCIALPNTSKTEEVVEINKEVIVQDYSSQRISEFLPNYKPQTTNHKLQIWDCCAGSGGKSILAKDVLCNIDLTVSDIRESILANLKKRFAEAGIKKYNSFIADLSIAHCPLPIANFDLIIADVPCTGSGTWSRTPEQLYYFKNSTIEEYSHLQKKIVSNVISKLEPGGHLLYITCSVFKKENEEVANFMQQKFQLQLIKQEVLIGYDKKADTMFAVLLQKPISSDLS